MIPVGEKLIIKQVKAERVTAGGIVIPEDSAKKNDIAQMKAEVVAIGPLAFEMEKKYEKDYGVNLNGFVPKVGDIILMAKYAGVNVKHNGEDYRIIKDEDVTVVLEEGDV